MSCYEWEAGTIVLPSAEAKKVRDAVRAVADAHRASLYDEAQRFWKELPAAYKRDNQKYSRAAYAFAWGNQVGEYGHDPKLPAWRAQPDPDGGFGDDLQQLLTSVLYGGGGGKPRRIRKPDVDKVTPNPTGANPSFNCGEGHLRFEGRKAHWSVGENNHARDRGRIHPIAKAFFAALERVVWTRGSGGQIVGNDEYSRDSREAGGGANYVIDEYGPKVQRQRVTAGYGGYVGYGYGRR